MKFLYCITFTSCVLSATCYIVDPPTTAPNDTIQDCTNWVVASSTINCQTIASNYSITLKQFEVDYVSTAR
jgi:hypothetical protein